MALHFLLKKRIIFVFCALLVMIATSSLAAHKDPAPLPDDVVQHLVQGRHEGDNPLASALGRHLDEAAELIRQTEDDVNRGDKQKRSPASLPAKQMQLEGKEKELEILRAEIRVYFKATRERLVSLGLTEKVNEWDGLLAQVEKRFEKIVTSLKDVRTAPDKARRDKAIARAKHELYNLHQKVKERETALPQEPVPTRRHDAAPPEEIKNDEAPPPAYLSQQQRPEKKFYAFLGNTLLADPDPVPAEAQSCGYTAADLGENLEVKLTQEIRALAAKLEYSPVRIFEYVTNEIKYEPYLGSLKGAMGTLVSGGGNATDQASLLIALLRASNIPARYVKGNISFTNDPRGLRWVGAKDYPAASAILRQGRINASSTASSLSISSHVWVEACVPYAHYRGAKVDPSGQRWIPLDPSFKDRTYQDGIATNVSFDYNGYLATRSINLPLEAYERQVEAFIKGVAPNYGNNTLEDVPYKGRQVPLKLDILPASLPYEVGSFFPWGSGITTSDTGTLPDAHRNKVQITVKNSTNTKLLDHTVTLPETVLSRITLSFKGATSDDQTILNTWLTDNNQASALPCTVNVVPVIKVDGVEAKSGTGSVGLCTDINTLEMQVTQGETSIINYVKFGNKISAADYHALQAYAFQASDRLLTERAARLITTVRNTAYPNSNIEETEGEFLHLVGLKYMRYITDAGKRIGGLDGGSGESGNHLGLAASQMKVQYLFDLPFAVNREGFLVDVPAGMDRNVDLSTGNTVWKTFLLGGYAQSAYESYIWQENSRLDAVSTVRGIQFARETGIEILTLTSANWAAESPKLLSNVDSSLDYTPADVDNIYNNYINPNNTDPNKKGYTITIPRSLIQYETWKGQVYVAEKNDIANSGVAIAAYAIKRYAGGKTVGNQVSQTTYNSTLGSGFQSASTGISTDAAVYRVCQGQTGNGITQYTTRSGDPVNMVTGNVYHTERDLSLKGRGGFPIVFERSYNSREAKDGPLGFGWTHSLNHFLTFKDDNANDTTDSGDTDGITSSVQWTDGTGSEKLIPVAGNASGVPVGSAFTPPKGFFFQVARNGDGTYTIREKNGLIYTFESIAGTVEQKSKLLSIRDRNGNTLTLNYTGGNLTSVTDGLGRSLTFIYTGSRITEVRDWTNRRHLYVYDGSGNLTSYKNPLAVAGAQNPVSYDYYAASDGTNINHALKKYTLPRGNGMTFEYYANGRAFRHYNTLGETTTFTYNDFRRETVQVNERGHTRHFFFDKYGNPSSIVEENGGRREYAYDPANPYNRTEKTDPEGYKTRYDYDTGGNVTKITNPSGSAVEFYNFNTFSQPGKVKDANGNYTVFKYDANGNLLQEIKLKSGIGAAVNPATYAPSASDIVAWTVNSYDGYGNLLSARRVRDFAAQIANPASLTGPTAEYGYTDTVNNVQGLNITAVTRRGDKNGDAIIDAAEFDTANLSYDAMGRLKTGINADWYPTQVDYDAVDRVVKATDSAGNLRDYLYDSNGNTAAEKLILAVNGLPALLDSTSASYDLSDRKQTVTDAGGFVTVYQYDAAGNVVKITNPDNYTLAFEYDENNRVLKAYDQENNAVSRTLDLSGKPRSITDPNGNTVTYEYYDSSKDGRINKVTQPKTTFAAGRAVQYDYDNNGNVTTVTEIPADGSASRTTTTTYDEMNRPTRIVGPSYTDASLGLIRPVTKYVYDTLGNLTQVMSGHTDSSGTNPASDVVTPQMTYAYDDFGRKLKETDPLGNFWTFAYDVNNNVATVIDAKSQVTGYTWGYGHQLLTRTNTSGNATYTRNLLGQVTNAQTPEVTYSYTYDEVHRLAGVTDSRGNKSLTYSYSPGGLLNWMMDSDGNRTDYLYDPVGRLSGIWAPNLDYVTFRYDPGGRLTEKWFPNGVTARYSYNADNSLAQVVNRSSSNTIISQHDYTYDGFGNRQTYNEQVGTTSTPYRYVYDELNRLTEVRNNTTSALIEGYTYDPIGNRQTKTDGVTPVYYIYDSANQLKEIRQGSTNGTLLASLGYDSNGNLTSKSEGATTTGLGYDFLNRLTSVTKTGLANQGYTYDDQGRRIAKTGGATTTSYLYSGPDIVGEYASWTAADALYTHGPNTDDPIIRATSAGLLYYHQDGLGSVVAVSDQHGSGAAPVNVASAVNGGSVTVSSRYNETGYLANNANNGDNKGANNGFWQGSVSHAASYYDWVQVEFSGTQTISEIDVFSAQSSLTAPVEPTESLTFSYNGLVDFDVQYWDGLDWVTVPGGSVTGNNKVWRKITFPAVTTNKVRVAINGALGGYSKLVELEAYTNATPAVNAALAANGGIATASNTYTGYPAGNVNNGDRKGASNSYWQGNVWHSTGSYLDWLQIDFGGTQTISEIDVISAQTSLTSPVEPTETLTFTSNGLTDFDVQYWDGAAWATVPGGSITGNNKVWRKVTFPAVTTSRIRVLVKGAISGGYSKLVELRAWNTDATPQNVALSVNGGVASASGVYSNIGYMPVNLNDGNRKGDSSKYWVDWTNNVYPDWVRIDFSGEKSVSEVDLFSAQSGTPVEPTETLTFSTQGITAFDVQYWDGASWQTAASVTGNNKVWRKVTFTPVKTTSIRVQINAALGGYSRIAEIEVYTPVGGGEQRFDAWGNTIAASGNPIPQYGYTAREPDETGLVYYRARYYDPTIGRFTQRDPIGLEGGINPYTYVNANPVNFTDPQGLMAFNNANTNTATQQTSYWGGSSSSQASSGMSAGVQSFAAQNTTNLFADAGRYADTASDADPSGIAVGKAFGALAAWGYGLATGDKHLVDAAVQGMAENQQNNVNAFFMLSTLGEGGVKGGIHKNSLEYVGETHVYRVKGPDGSTYKIGESAQGVRTSDGSSIRAEQQARRLTRETGDAYSTEIRQTFPDKASARGYETSLIERFRRLFGKDTLPGNRTNR